MFLSRFSLEGKVALVTGGSRGIGRVAALGLAEAGADLVVASRNLHDLEIVADEIRMLKRRALAVKADVAKMDDIEKLTESAQVAFGKIDILVNNAGMGGPAPFLDVEESLWDTMMNLNLKGLFFLSQKIASVMKEHGGGTIINVASAAGFTPAPAGSVYAISKAGVIMATRAMANDLARYKIRVNTLAPGYIRTPMANAYFDSHPLWEQKLLNMIPLAYIAEADELVGVIIYLASNASSYQTGATIIVDGGLLNYNGEG